MNKSSQNVWLWFLIFLVLAWIGSIYSKRAGADDYLDDLMSAAVGRAVTPSDHQAEHICAALGFRMEGWPNVCPPVASINLVMPLLLDAVNAERAQGHQCGSQWMPPVPPLRWSWDLQEAARDQVQDMVGKGYFGHVSPQGRTARHWAKDRGYRWWVQDDLYMSTWAWSPEGALAAWLADPPHCVPILDARAKDFAAYCEGAKCTALMGWWGIGY